MIETHRARPAGELRTVTFDGNGVGPEVREGAWERIRDLIYEGRGA